MAPRKAIKVGIALFAVILTGVAWTDGATPWGTQRGPWGMTLRMDQWARTPAGPVRPAWCPAGASGCWTPIGAASQAASYADLSHNGHTLSVLGSAPSWSATTGWTVSGATGLDTGLAGSAIGGICVRVAGGSTTVAAIWVGAQNSTVTQRIYAGGYVTGTSRAYLWGGGTASIVSGKIATGVLCMAGTTAYLDGASDATLTAGTRPAQTVTLGGLHMGDGSMASRLTGRIIAAVTWSSPPDGATIASVSEALEALGQ